MKEQILLRVEIFGLIYLVCSVIWLFSLIKVTKYVRKVDWIRFIMALIILITSAAPFSKAVSDYINVTDKYFTPAMDYCMRCIL